MTELEQQLTARVAELEDALSEVSLTYETEYAGQTLEFCSFCDALVSENDHDPDCKSKALNRTSPRSLNILKAEGAREVEAMLRKQGYPRAADNAMVLAEQLEKGEE
jgi:hypothetical protein